ncbi:MAG: hypothetical protein HY360_22050 [Verrucomicrobia bacterium]|nr:hypothetical protein [Verrucomicrobiota bacterium]
MKRDQSAIHSPELLNGFIRCHQNFSPDLYEEVNGIAEGSNVSMDDIWLVNGYWRYFRELECLKPETACTSFCYRRPGTREVFIGQTSDHSDPKTQDYMVAFTLQGNDIPETFMVAFSGSVGLFGFNANGLGVMLNNLPTLDVKEGVTAFFAVREALRCKTARESSERLEKAVFGACHHFLIADPSGAVFGIETAGDRTARITPETEWYAHANHYTDSRFIGPNMPPAHLDPNHAGHNSYLRQNRMSEILQEFPDDADEKMLLAALGDHDHAPSCICVHEPQNGKTCAAIVVALHKRKAFLATGNPCEGVFAEIRL